MQQLIDQPVPSARQLIKATLIAIGVALVILVVAVLPAEYGIDPTGIGGAMGLTALNGSEPEPDITPKDAAAAGSAQGPAVARVDGTFSIDERTIILPAYEGVELKADMNSGQAFVFSWATEGARDVFVDMHGEPRGAAANEFTSYWKEKQQSSGQGTFTAQFDGTHGWYWQNTGEDDVTIKVQVSGVYNKIYQPE